MPGRLHGYEGWDAAEYVPTSEILLPVKELTL